MCVGACMYVCVCVCMCVCVCHGVCVRVCVLFLKDPTECMVDKNIMYIQMQNIKCTCVVSHSRAPCHIYMCNDSFMRHLHSCVS